MREIRDQIGQKATEFVAEKAYDRYGDKVPFDVNAQDVADRAYAAYQHHRDKKERRRKTAGLLKVLCFGAVGVICACGVYSALSAKHHGQRFLG